MNEIKRDVRKDVKIYIGMISNNDIFDILYLY